jgi:hypothetical protein
LFWFGTIGIMLATWAVSQVYFEQCDFIRDVKFGCEKFA